jgi:hypothetical protein
MVRAAKKPRNKDSSKFKDAVDASSQEGTRPLRRRARRGGARSTSRSSRSDERAKAGELLGQKNIELRKRAMPRAAAANNEVKDLKRGDRQAQRRGLRGRAPHEGAEEPAPGTEGEP